jgi:hypothetical protein
LPAKRQAMTIVTVAAVVAGVAFRLGGTVN